MSYHYLFKFIIIGDTAVGKSCILYQFLEQKFRVKHEMTVGVEFGAKVLDLDGKQIKLQIWDTAGQETFKSITRQYYRSAAGAILVYDVTRRESFENVREWIKECQVHGTQDMVIVLVGNKVDLEKQYNIHNINGQLANEKNLLFIETSAKDNLNIIETFSQAASQVLKIVQRNQQKGELPGVRVGQAINQTQLQQQSSTSNGCC
ncbi:unnamed protein product (macronuclear) [Paramecium tetraurelia]|uniref:Chromosome undetermined scaffold_50, whole genome shotgun sequence n=1 Tax=Paramecium tetraurelia TaxID=5888 RepID=Q3SDN1_PARTE|nr:uncharacterized protein GSPATT00016883001 [Paramecium tetraurelia]CAI39327.1 rab_B60 [Paramecium tetraurelia]CAK82496.1 unnamed protein product [Paramecium tetraurelia]|eukprot:XP_001449893.1 hypothetical protein (macronuclear) [Paramecium tetraurelia strain d4-2]